MTGRWPEGFCGSCYILWLPRGIIWWWTRSLPVGQLTPARPLVKPLTGLTLVVCRFGMAVSGRQNMGAWLLSRVALDGHIKMKKMIALLAGGLLLSSAVQAKGEAGEFDYYAMALSWSPEHCAVKPADRDQCSRKLGFVLHGLWPQVRSRLSQQLHPRTAQSRYGERVCRPLPQPFPLSP